MSALTFTLKQTPRQRLDVSPLTPDRLRDLSIEQINALLLSCGNTEQPVTEWFDVAGDDALNMVVTGHDRLDFIGQGMSRGKITVNGDAGAYLGQHMQGGEIQVSGDVGLYAACELKNGLIVIDGNAGDFLGAALPGNKAGMKGGTVLVKGNVGDRAGDHLRRGRILIEGDAGAYLGARMIAGTIAVMGKVGAYPGFAMRRGTLLLWQSSELTGNFNDCGAHTLSFLPMLFASFQALPGRFSKTENAFNRVRRYAGDMAELGRGEVLVRIHDQAAGA